MDAYVQPWRLVQQDQQSLNQKLIATISRENNQEERHTKITALINNKANVNWPNMDTGKAQGHTPLFIEASRPEPRLEIIQKLLDARANPEQEILPIPAEHPKTGHTPLYSAIKNNKNGDTLALMLTYAETSRPINSAYYYAYDLSSYFSRLRRSEVKYKYVVKGDYYYSETSLLMVATQMHNVPAVIALLDTVDPILVHQPKHRNSDGYDFGLDSPLSMAMKKNFPDIVELILKHFVKHGKPDYRMHGWDTTDDNLKTPLEWALKNENGSCAFEALKALRVACKKENSNNWWWDWYCHQQALIILPYVIRLHLPLASVLQDIVISFFPKHLEKLTTFKTCLPLANLSISGILT